MIRLSSYDCSRLITEFKMLGRTTTNLIVILTLLLRYCVAIEQENIAFDSIDDGIDFSQSNNYLYWQITDSEGYYIAQRYIYTFPFNLSIVFSEAYNASAANHFALPSYLPSNYTWERLVAVNLRSDQTPDDHKYWNYPAIWLPMEGYYYFRADYDNGTASMYTFLVETWADINSTTVVLDAPTTTTFYSPATSFATSSPSAGSSEERGSPTSVIAGTFVAAAVLAALIILVTRLWCLARKKRIAAATEMRPSQMEHQMEDLPRYEENAPDSRHRPDGGDATTTEEAVADGAAQDVDGQSRREGTGRAQPEELPPAYKR